MSATATFESRLREHISKLFELPSTERSPQWARTLHTRSPEQWAQDVSKITLDVAKKLLSSERAPTGNELRVLPAIGDEHRPGVYVGFLFGKFDVKDEWIYIGSATSPGKGLAHRKKKHQRKSHRDDVKKRGEGSFFYTLVDEKSKNRALEFFRFCVADFASGNAADVMHTRETCLLAEQIYSGWMRSFGTKSREVFGPVAIISPWDDSTLGGTNYTPPIKQPIKEADPESIAATTPAELRKKKAAHKTAAKAKETAEERAARLERERKYAAEVTRPVKEMRANGATEEEIKKFKDDHKLKMKLLHPPPKSDGKGKRYKFDTATERTADDRVEDHKLGRKSLKRSALAELPSNITDPEKKRKS